MSDTKNAPDVVELDDVQFRAAVAEILERGHAHLALNVDLTGTGLHGEWFRNDPTEIARAKMLGFKIDEEHARKNSVHSDGTGKVIYGDVVFMTIPEQRKKIIDATYAEMARRKHGIMKDDKLVNQSEDAQFKNLVNKDLASVGITAIDSPSDSKQISGSEIAGIIGNQ